MLRLDKVLKPWKESATLNAHINLYGFWNETAFLTKSGDLGMVLRDCARITSQIRLDRIVPAREYFAWSEAQ